MIVVLNKLDVLGPPSAARDEKLDKVCSPSPLPSPLPSPSPSPSPSPPPSPIPAQVATKKHDFERLLGAMLCHMHGAKYVPVRSPDARELPPQLMGLLTLVLVHEHLAPTVRQPHIVLIPTGLGGLSGTIHC